MKRYIVPVFAVFAAAVFFKTAVARNEIPIEQLRIFGDIYAKVQQYYVDETDNEVLMEDAIAGLLTGLDPHSGYLPPEENKAFRVAASGQFGGLGITVSMEAGFVKVISPIDDTPAARAGIEAGDLIIQIDDTRVKGITLDKAVEMMRGQPGTRIVLTVVREGESKPLTVPIIRSVIKVAGVRARLLEPNFGYLRISQFRGTTVELAEEHLEKLVQENKAPLHGLVLDLRNNPGGTLDAAIGISDLFLSSGAIVIVKGKGAENKAVYSATAGDVLDGAPIVVLINQGSASASEIVSGALQDHKRGVILGTRSFGKASVQTVMPLANGGGLRLTTARYYTPNDRSIQAEGIVPDIELRDAELTIRNEARFSTTEANLPGHLKNPNEDVSPKKADDETTEEDIKTAQDALEKAHAQQEKAPERITVEDYPLYEALHVLKAMYLVGRK